MVSHTCSAIQELAVMPFWCSFIRTPRDLHVSPTYTVPRSQGMEKRRKAYLVSVIVLGYV